MPARKLGHPFLPCHRIQRVGPLLSSAGWRIQTLVRGSAWLGSDHESLVNAIGN